MSDLGYVEACLLGLVQGLTEFLPVSSSGHLVILQRMLGFAGETPEMLLFDVMTHFGTIGAVIVVFMRTFHQYIARLARELRPGYSGKRTAVLVLGLGIAACIPTAAIGLGFKDEFESAFSSLRAVGLGLLATGAALFVVGRLPRPRRGWRRIGWWRAGVIGAAQGCAILPGVSRSGATICAAMALGLKRRWAAEFSFFIAVPPILGAGVIKLMDTLDLPAEQLAAIPWGPIAVGTLVSFASGAVALNILLTLVVREKLQHFCYYCWLVGATVLIWGVS